MEWLNKYENEKVYHKCNIYNFSLLDDELFIKYLDELFEIYNYSKKIERKIILTINIECNSLPRIFFFRKYLKYFKNFNNLMEKYVEEFIIEVNNFFSKILLRLILLLIQPKINYNIKSI
jgi:DNA-directed RNA polymerase subunit F